MNTKQLRETANECCDSGEDDHIWLWYYPKLNQFVWSGIRKSSQLDKQRNDISDARLD